MKIASSDNEDSFIKMPNESINNINGGSNQILPNAQQGIQNNYFGKFSSRMSSYFDSLEQEILGKVDDKVLEDVIDNLRYYKTKLDGTKGFEGKLTDWNFKPAQINDALHFKELYAKKATKYECYPAAQQINLDLFARIKHEFDTSITPLIEDKAPLRTIMREVHDKIVKPIMDFINDNGEHDKYLQYTEDHIYGMIYYLTGMCHLNWTDYDNI